MDESGYCVLRERTSMQRVRAVMLSRPSYLIWVLSTVIAVLVIASKYFGVASLVPVVGPLVAQHTFEFMLIAFSMIWAGTVFKAL
jgi:hypothetical protein